jgi:prepilin-type N-terminal cleavage/methylation domain-containing protein
VAYSKIQKQYFGKQGFTLIEVLVSLVLVGVLVLILSTLVLPLGISRSTNIQTQAVSFGRSYLELIKTRWQIKNEYLSLTVPNTDPENPPVDIALPSGWKIEANIADWKATDTIRTVRITVKPSTTSSEWVKLETRISLPSE